MEEKFDYGKFQENLDNFFKDMKFIDTGGVFTNTKCVFIDYIDIIQSPGLSLLYDMRRLIKENPTYAPYLKTDEILSLTGDGLVEWFVNRKHKNPLIDLCKVELDEKTKEELDETYDIVLENAKAYHVSPLLNFFNVLNYIKDTKTLIEKIVIYTKKEIPAVDSILKEFFGRKRYEYVNGSFKDVVTNHVPADSTYILSDIEYVKELKDMGKLRLSSILLPIEYRYNKLNRVDWKYDLAGWQESEPCKIFFFAAIADKNDNE